MLFDRDMPISLALNESGKLVLGIWCDGIYLMWIGNHLTAVLMMLVGNHVKAVVGVGPGGFYQLSEFNVKRSGFTMDL